MKINFENQVKDLFASIKQFELDENRKAKSALASSTFYLTKDTLLCYPRGDGDARYPYAYGGLTFWAYASGNVKMEECLLNFLLPSYEGKEPNFACFAGLKEGDGFLPVSLTGASKQGVEKGVTRYTVFMPKAVFYLTKTPAFNTAVRIFVDEQKALRVSLYIENLTDAEITTYLSLYADFLMTQWSFEQDDAKYFKWGKVTDKGYLFHTSEGDLDHYGVITRSNICGQVQSTVSRKAFTGSIHNQLTNAKSLFSGELTAKKDYVEFTETAIMADLINLNLGAKQSASVTYTCAFNDDESLASNIANTAVSVEETDEILSSIIDKDKNPPKNEVKPEFIFNGANIGSSDQTLNSFIANVIRQVEFCSRAKNYVGPFVGIRDIFQQIESSLMWIPNVVRAKIIDAIGYIGDDGRAPRQYAYPLVKGGLPRMDLRPFIDQGVWIISTVYTYLTFTGDYSILDEVCGYYHLEGYSVSFSNERDTVLDHLLRITDYLTSALAEDTGCLRVLFGDWNDALDGLGRPDDKTKDFGNGVSVMATLQLFKNLTEMIAILNKVGKTERIKRLENCKETIKRGLIKHAIVSNENGERKIVHGWGDNLRFKVGSYCDNDKISRDGVTASAFWILAKAIDWDRSLIKDILASYDRLDSKYGLKTFEPYFALDNKDVGRIIRLPKGTAENGATYIHATLFAVMSLFEIGESKRAWEQLYKALPITHDFISTSPFVMPNSYVHDDERLYDGESMSDWFTGSGCVLIKILTWYVFGITPDLDGVTICPCSFMPCESASATLRVKGVNVNITVKNTGKTRKYIVNGSVVQGVYDEKLKTEKIYLTNEQLSFGDLNIVVE